MVNTVPLVVVAEADRLASDLLCGYLAANGLRVEPARDGMQAYLKTIRLHPDVLVTDLRLPRIDGFELAGRLKADPRSHDIPIVGIHDANVKNPAQRAEGLGMARLIAGPVELPELLHQLHDVLRQTRSLRREAALLREHSRMVRLQVRNLILRARALIEKSRLLDRQHVAQ